MDIDIRALNPYGTDKNGLIALFKGSLLTLAWGKTLADYKQLYAVQFSTDGELLVTTTCCTDNQYLLIFKLSDGSLLRAATYPDSDGAYDLTTRNLVMTGLDPNGNYNVWLNVKKGTLSPS